MESMGGGPTPEQMALPKNETEKVKSPGSEYHDKSRQFRWREESNDYEPLIKKTKDQAWSEAHGGAVEVDVANTPYEGLPSDLQRENDTAAKNAQVPRWLLGGGGGSFIPPEHQDHPY